MSEINYSDLICLSQFKEYLKKEDNKRNNENIISRIKTLLVNQYTNRNTKVSINFHEGLDECIQAISNILKSKKAYHSIVLQTLGVVFININDAIEKDKNNRTLKDLRSALVHYYLFIESSLPDRCNKSKLNKEEANKLQNVLMSFYGTNSDTVCFTQREVRDNFKSRLHSQDRLYNPKLLLPMTLILKILGAESLTKGWTNKAIDDIDILVSKKKKIIKFKDISFFMFTSNHIFIFVLEGNGVQKYSIYTRKYTIQERSDAELVEVHNIEQPLQAFAIDHVVPMMKLIENQVEHLDKVTELKRLSDDFIDFVVKEGKSHIKKSWIEAHPRAQGLGLLTSKTINDLAKGYIQYLTKAKKLMTKEQKQILIEDINTLHCNGKAKLELMDKFENGKKGGDN